MDKQKWIKKCKNTKFHNNIGYYEILCAIFLEKPRLCQIIHDK